MRDSIKPVMRLTKTNALIIEPGISYDQAGVVFDSDYQYGGIYNISDGIKPHISFFTDFAGSAISPSPSDGMTGMPMGLLLSLLYP